MVSDIPMFRSRPTIVVLCFMVLATVLVMSLRLISFVWAMAQSSSLVLGVILCISSVMMSLRVCAMGLLLLNSWDVVSVVTFGLNLLLTIVMCMFVLARLSERVNSIVL